MANRCLEFHQLANTGPRYVANFLLVVALLIAGCSSGKTPSTPPAAPGATPAAAGSQGLKHIDQAALQAMLDKTAKELMVPGAIILLRTPEGEFTLTYGTTLLGATVPPRADTCFRAASNTKTMTAAIIMQLAQAMQERLFGPLRLLHTVLPGSAVNSLPEPYSHGYLYGSASVAMVGTPPYSPQVQAAARAGTLLPKDYTNLNHSFAAAAGGVVSTANNLATWIQALVGGRVLNSTYQHLWLDSPQPEDPSKPDGQQYGYGIAKLHWGPNTMSFHGGELPGYNSFMGDDPANHVTFVVWTNLTVSLDENQTANALMLKVLDQIYVVSPLTPAQGVERER